MMPRSIVAVLAALALAFPCAAGPRASAPVAGAVLVPVSAAASPDAADDLVQKRQDILRLFELNGVKKTVQAQLDAMAASFTAMPGMTPELMQALKEEVAKDFDRMLEISVKPYMEHVSHDDIKALIAFAESPVGQRMAAIQPTLVAETTRASMQWAQRLQIRLTKRAGELRAQASGGAGAAAAPGQPEPADKEAPGGQDASGGGDAPAGEPAPEGQPGSGNR